MRIFLLSLVILLSGCQLKISYLGKGDVVISGDHSIVSCDLSDLCADLGYNDQVTLTARPNPGYHFVSWSGDCRGSDACTITANKERNVLAHFAPNESEPKTIEFNPNNGFFFASPWPNDLRLKANGALNVEAFPFDTDGLWSNQLTKLAENTKGFSTNGTITLQTSWQLPALNDVPTSNAYLMELDSAGYETVPVSLYTFSDDKPERFGIISFLPSKTLKSNTRYALVVNEAIAEDLQVSEGVAKSELIKAFENDSQDLTALEADYKNQFDEVRLKLEIVGENASKLLAYSVFTTQNTQRYVELIQNTIAEWDQAFITQSFNVIDEYDCTYFGSASDQLAHTIIALVDFPKYLAGDAPYTSGSGNFVVEDNKLIQQGTETVNLKIEIPCGAAAGVDSLGVLVEGAETASVMWQDYHSKGVVEVLVDAPYSNGTREPQIDGILGEIVELAGVGSYELLRLLSHFNPFNMESNLGLHYQYGIDLVFARHVANHLDVLAESPDWPVPISSEKTVYSGTSFGSIAAKHAARIDQTTDALHLISMSRMSHFSLNHLLEYATFLPDIAIKLISAYVGVDLPVSPVEPELHLLQTVLEPVDTSNHVPYLAHLPILIQMDSYDAPLHGGPSSYNLLKAFDDSVSFNLAYGYRSEPSESYNRIQELLGRNYVENPNYQLPFYGDGPLRLVQQTIAREWNYCFAYAVLNYPSWDYDAPASIPCFDN